eukprot:1646431-Prymnesium_polylepis.1
MLNELRRLDGAYPTKAGKVIEWLASLSRSASELGSDSSQFALLFYLLVLSSTRISCQRHRRAR